MSYINGSAQLCLVDRRGNGLSAEMFDDVECLLDRQLWVWLCRNAKSSESATLCRRRLRAMAHERLDRIIAEFIRSEYERNKDGE